VLQRSQWCHVSFVGFVLLGETTGLILDILRIYSEHFCKKNKNTMKPVGSLKNIFQAFL
jgi:hypothetical protein